MGEAGPTAWEMPTGSVGSVKTSDTGSSPMPWPREGGLSWCREDELWPPRVFAIPKAWMVEGLGDRGGGVATGE